MKDKIMKNKILVGIIVFISTLLITSGGYFGVTKYLDYKAKLAVEEINKTLEKEFSKESCQSILNFDIEDGKNNKNFKLKKYIKYRGKCDKKYNIINISQTLSNCKNIIKSDQSDFKKDYILLDHFEIIQKECSEKYLTAKIKKIKFFDVSNDFKSSIGIDFSMDFFEDKGKIASPEFIKNRTKAKEKLIDLLNISPKVELNVDDIVLYPKKGIINLDLKPLTEYKITLNPFENKNLETHTKQEILKFTTPENKYLGIVLKNPVSLYMDTNPPKIELIKYNLKSKKDSSLKICRISKQNYSKIEILRGRKDNIKEKEDFFTDGIDKIETINCIEKNIVFSGENILEKQEIDLGKEITGINKNGLYYVTFSNKEDRNINNNLQYPIFFGIINSHITMKVSKNGKAFFFVNDFKGNPLKNQEIKANINIFQDHKRNWNNKERKFETQYFSPLDKMVLGKEILLGKTNSDGILEVDLKGKIDNAFDKTFQTWSYEWSGIDDSFFITSSSEKYLSYNHSKWNSGIAPWNFGYDFTPQFWGRQESKYYSHTFSDRKLYLPGEEVYLKSIIRNSSDLKIPVNKEFNLIVKDSKNKEILNSKLKLSEFGSISDKLKLDKNTPLGIYRVILKDDNREYGHSSFSVEVFKNPTFKTDISLKTIGLENSFVKVKEDKNISGEFSYNKKYSGNFTIKADIKSSYYNGANLENNKYSYKVYKQYYWPDNYWKDCYWGCNWEPRKEFYTEGKGVLDENGEANFDINVDFKSSYDDYKYIVETTVEDNLGEKISSANSVIAKLPDNLKSWNPSLDIKFQSEKKFYKQGTKATITGGLSIGKWTKDYDNKYLLVIKKKNYITKYINDIRGYKRPINSFEEKIEKVLLVNSKNFKVNSKGKLETIFIPKETGEYVFEYGKINFDYLNKNNIEVNSLLTEDFSPLKKEKNIDNYISNKKYFTVLSYGNNNAKNPIASDNKIKVLSEKVSYKIGERAKILVRLPFSKGKILWTVEKQGVVKKEYINVNSNIFFKEITIDDTFVPNAYIGVVAIEVDDKKVPEYKVGYTEIVVDKSEKKSFVEIKSNKKVYKPGEKVVLNIKNTTKNKYGKQSELTVMVVDDSLISLMGNIDLNILEKFYKKLPFQIQTSLTNLAMLKNYYFSRPGIVGGSGFGNFKGGDSAVNSRVIFKNTAYYNPSVITDKYGNARVEFKLPDNLTNFRIMVLSNSKDNFFGYGSSNIEVRKNVIIEDKTPLIYRSGDKIEIGAKIFNNTSEDIGFKVKFDSNDIEVDDSIRKIYIKANSNEVVNFWTTGQLDTSRDIKYTISALGNTKENSDKIEKTIENKEFPSLGNTIVKGGLAKKGEKQHFKINIPENTDLKKSKVKISFSNNLLEGIQKTIKSLLVYPYGCIEQTTSTTYPNAILLKFSKLFPGIIEEDKAKKNLKAGIDRIKSMQTTSGGFAYWQGEDNPNLHITPYVLRRLIDMEKFGANVPKEIIEKSSKYLEKNLGNIKENIDRTETFYTFSKLNRAEEAYNKLLKGVDKSNFSRHELIAYTYGLITWNKKENKEVIDKNIKKIIDKLDNNENQARYWSKRSDKALFISMLIDYGYDEKVITEYIKELYATDWSNYYYSTTAKNNAFIAFAKYMEKYGNNSSSNFAFSVGYIQNRNKRFWLGEEQPNTITREFNLDDVVQYKEDFIELTTFVISGKNIFTNLTLDIVPEDKFKIKETSNGMNVSRKILKLDNGKEITDGIFKKGELYKVKININFDKEKQRRNLALEDYIPSTFKIINSKFKTESIDSKDNNKSWRWNYIENLKDRIFANSSYVYGKNIQFEYTIRPEFKGNYTYPPVNVYMMYNGEINSHSKYEKIKVK